MYKIVKLGPLMAGRRIELWVLEATTQAMAVACSNGEDNLGCLQSLLPQAMAVVCSKGEDNSGCLQSLSS